MAMTAPGWLVKLSRAPDHPLFGYWVGGVAVGVLIPVGAVLAGVAVSDAGFGFSSVVGAGQLYLVSMSLLAMALTSAISERCGQTVVVFVGTVTLTLMLSAALVVILLTWASADLAAGADPELWVKCLAWASVLQLLVSGSVSYLSSLLIYGSGGIQEEVMV